MQVSIKRDSGMLKVDIDGKLYVPLSFKSVGLRLQKARRPECIYADAKDS